LTNQSNGLYAILNSLWSQIICQQPMSFTNVYFATWLEVLMCLYTLRVSNAEKELQIPSGPRKFIADVLAGVCVGRSLVFCVVFCKSLFVRLSFALSVSLRITPLITTLVSLNFSILICSWHAQIELTHAKTVTQYIPNTVW
jgi:hypothetical protein